MFHEGAWNQVPVFHEVIKPGGRLQAAPFPFIRIDPGPGRAEADLEEQVGYKVEISLANSILDPGQTVCAILPVRSLPIQVVGPILKKEAL